MAWLSVCLGGVADFLLRGRGSVADKGWGSWERAYDTVPSVPSDVAGHIPRIHSCRGHNNRLELLDDAASKHESKPATEVAWRIPQTALVHVLDMGHYLAVSNKH